MLIAKRGTNEQLRSCRFLLVVVQASNMGVYRV